MVTAALKTNATPIASAMSVIIPGKRARSSRAAPRRNGAPPYTKSAVPRTGGIHVDPGNAGACQPVADASMWPQTIVGSVRTRATQNRVRNIATLCPAWRSRPVWV
jgi:hypothetical protein